jgi:hypothetical protein
MNTPMRLVALTISVVLLLLIVELVRRRRLREEFSWLWILTGAAILVLAAWPGLLVRIRDVLGAQFAPSILFFGGLMFLTSISLHFSTKISRLTDQLKEVAQRLALLDGELRELRGEEGDT